MLYSWDGATVPQCEELLELVNQFERRASDLGVLAERREAIDEWRYYFKAYRDYLLQIASYRSFEQFLEEHPQVESIAQ